MTAIIGLIIIVLVGVYLLFQLTHLLFWWKVAATVDKPESGEAWPTVTLIVAARNEAKHLPFLLKDLKALDYPSDALEIVVVDDFSSDDTAAIARKFEGIRVLQLSDHIPDPNSIVAHKKAAITYAIAKSESDIVVTTDADCRWQAGGLKVLIARWQQGQFRSGPVLIEPSSGFLYGFQSLDMLSYMFLTGAFAARNKPILANGANLAIDRQLFDQVKGYRGVDHIASGDDVLLLHKINQANLSRRVRFMANPKSVVLTQGMTSWTAFWQQRLRWAGKTGHYKNMHLVWAQVVAFSASAALVAGLMLSLFDVRLLTLTVLAWVLKIACDGIILRVLCKHFDRLEDFRWYLPSALLYPFYLLAIGTAALMGVKAKWKGRKV
ncbi:MAG: glycosyltransferase [Bacteroidota bacterium]